MNFIFEPYTRNKIPYHQATVYHIDNSSFARTTAVKAENDVIDILTTEDMENTPLQSWM